MNNLKETDRKDQLLRRKEARYLREQEKKCEKKFAWNGLKEEVIMAKNVQQLKEKLDKYRYRDRTT